MLCLSLILFWPENIKKTQKKNQDWIDWIPLANIFRGFWFQYLMIIEMRSEMRVEKSFDLKALRSHKIINNFIPFCFSIFQFFYLMCIFGLFQKPQSCLIQKIKPQNNNNNIFKSFIIMFLVVSTIIIIFKIICWKILVLFGAKW